MLEFMAQFNSSVDGIGRLTAEDLAHTVWFFAKDLLPLLHEREHRIAEIHHAGQFFPS